MAFTLARPGHPDSGLSNFCEFIVFPFTASSRRAPHSDRTVFLPWIACVFVLILLAVTGLDLCRNYQDQQDQAVVEAYNLRRLVEARVVGVLRETELVLDDMEANISPAELGRSDRLDPARAAALVDLLARKMASVPQVRHLGFVTPKGIYTYAGVDGLESIDISDRDYFRQLRDQPGMRRVYSDVLVARSDAISKVVVVAQRVDYPDGRFAGLVLCGIHLSFFQQLLETLDVGAHGAIGFRDQHLEMLAGVPFGVGQTGPVPADSPVGQQVLSGKTSGHYLLPSVIDGKNRMTSWGWMPNLPYILFIGIAESDYLQPWYSRLFILGSGTIVLVLLAVGIIWLYRQDIIRRDALARSRKQLESSEARFRLMVDALPLPLLVTRLDGDEVLYANPLAAEMFGCPASDLQPSGQLSYMDPERRRLLMRRVAGVGSVSSEEVRLRRGSGESFWALVSATSIEFNGEPAVMIGINDISSRKEMELSLQVRATTDALTGAANRACLMEVGDKLLKHSLRYQHELSVLMLDIDHFKRINDTWGHPVGDTAIQGLVSCCCAMLRDSDIFGRMGGEEFLVLLPDTDLAQAQQAAERMRLAVEALRTACANGSDETFGFTVSIGVATLRIGDDYTLENLLTRADQALYRAKRSGRNRVVVDGRPQDEALPAHAMHSSFDRHQDEQQAPVPE